MINYPSDHEVMLFIKGSHQRKSLIFLLSVGGLLIILAIFHTLNSLSAEHSGIINHSLELLLLGGPAIGVLGVTYRTTTVDIEDELYRTIGYWCAGGIVVMLLVVVLALYYLGASLWNHDAIFVYQLGIGLGAFGGVSIGLHEARAISRAREASLSQEQRDRLEHLNHLLRHDILNNLTIISGNIELIIEDADEEIVDRLETIRRQSKEATELIQNVRVLVQASQHDQPLESIDLTKTIEKEITALRDAYPDARLTADLPSGVSVRADNLAGSVFENLIRNAIQHNDSETPRVSVTAETDEDTVTVTITDNGPGIPPEIRDDIFSPSEEGDHGFGMYLAQTLVNRYGGKISIADTGPEGTSIEIELNRP